MICIRCILIVKNVLTKLGLPFIYVEIGDVEIPEDLTTLQHKAFSNDLKKFGLELIDDRKSVLIQKIKNVIIDQVHFSEEPLAINFSEYLSRKLNYDYTYLANLFSDVQGTTIEKFIIRHKIERVKELLIYDELNLTEISFLMHYSSVAHLSSQFKKVTGQTPSVFKRLTSRRRTRLEEI